ncbi:hypothetical protein ACFY1V_13055 [Streptomyces sp. NPDC001255]|uniref:hypothetical protein n=1 Tax=Streptomyces sp. NPDC001255 TaxID=3364550 RepID=UPI0036861AF5
MKKAQRIVVPICPPNTPYGAIERYQVEEEAAAIVVPADPARAAAQVVRRLLPRYELTLAQLRTSPGTSTPARPAPPSPHSPSFSRMHR